MRQAEVMPDLPTPVRAALGLAATALDEARHLPDKAIELPMLAVSTALQISLRAQQRYAAFAARGDALLAGRGTTDDAPPWATFDPPPADGTGPASAAETGEPADADDSGGAPGPLDDVTDLAARRPNTPRARTSRPKKTVRSPRNGAPSAFDTVGDDESN